MLATGWMDEAACKDADPELFFPEHGGKRADSRKALEICGGCPVREECLEYALEADNRHFGAWGIWGGVPQSLRGRIR